MVTATTAVVGLVLICALLGLTLGLEINPIVEVKQGRLRGRVAESREGRKYVQFLGIPYAGKPRRFQPASPPSNWTGLRDGTSFGPNCIQWDDDAGDVIGAEDCLTLNVFTPVYSNPKQTRLPVMVYIHGGSFIKGSGSDYGPDYFMDEDVVLVTFNYRVGTFGFLTTLNKNLIPNLGMKDQVTALTWIKENVGSFGGDDKRITIFGSGAGAVSVSYHILSPLSRGLFHSAISQSGNALCPWALVRNPLDIAMELGKLLNCSTANSFTIAACLKVTPAREIVAKQQKLMGWSPSAVSFYPFGPVIELLHHSIETGPMFLPESPTTLLREGRFTPVPWLMGVNSADGLTAEAALALNSTKTVQLMNKYWQRFAPLIFSYKDTAPSPAGVSKKIRDFYFSTGIINSAAVDNFTEALSDGNFFRCTKNSALVYSHQQSPVWVYYFTHERTTNVLHSYGLDDLDFDGVPHSDELQYLFKMDLFPQITKRSRYFYFSRKLISLWVSFARSGAPVNLWGKGQKWDPLPRGAIKPGVMIKMYNIDNDTGMIDEPFFDRIAFWDKLRLFSPQATVASVTNTNDEKQDRQKASSSNGIHLPADQIGRIWNIFIIALFTLVFFESRVMI